MNLTPPEVAGALTSVLQHSHVPAQVQAPIVAGRRTFTVTLSLEGARALARALCTAAEARATMPHIGAVMWSVRDGTAGTVTGTEDGKVALASVSRGTPFSAHLVDLRPATLPQVRAALSLRYIRRPSR